MNYGIAIRTLGNAGEKYVMLMESIRMQTIQPAEVLVVLPHDYLCPASILGNEKIVFADKGMMSQRVASVEKSTCEFVLLLDDDLYFPKDFVERLAEPVLKGLADITFPVCEALLPKKGLDEISSAILLRAWPSKGRAYTRITATAGYSYRRGAGSDHAPVPAETAPGMCLFVRKTSIARANLHDELWVDKPVYSLKDDAVFVYKAFLCGARVYGVPRLEIKHLDGGAGPSGGRRVPRCFAYAFNTVMFWRKLIIPFHTTIVAKTVSSVCIMAWICMNSLFYLVVGIADNRFLTFVKGIAEAFREPIQNRLTAGDR